MIEDTSLLQVLTVTFVATFIRSAFGFGEALIAVPLLALTMPVNVAAPVVVLLSVTVAGIVVVQDWRQVHFRSVGPLFLATLAGAPLGLLVLMTIPGPIVKSALAAIVIAFSTYSLARPTSGSLQNDKLAWYFGFAAGILGSAYGMNGPPLVIYGGLRGWSPQRFRATLHGYFLPASTVVMGGYWLTGLWTPVVTSYYLKALPGVIVAIFLGRALNQRMNGREFLRYVHVGLIVLGMVLLLQVVI